MNHSLVFMTQSYFALVKNIRLNFPCYFIMEIPNKKELLQTASNYSSGIRFKDLMSVYKNCTAKQNSVLENHTTLPSVNSLCF